MAVIFNRVAGVSQYGTTPVEVPLSLIDESLGAVRLRLRELPEGLRRELDDRAKAGDETALREVVAWGVAGHDPNDFLEETPNGLKPLPYASTIAEYQGKEWPIASPETVDMYQRVLPQGVFLHSIKGALTLYHSGVVPTARTLWDMARGAFQYAVPVNGTTPPKPPAQTP